MVQWHRPVVAITNGLLGLQFLAPFKLDDSAYYIGVAKRCSQGHEVLRVDYHLRVSSTSPHR